MSYNLYRNEDRTHELPGPGMAGLGGMGDWGLPDFITKPVEFAVDVGVATVTGGASLLAPEQPGDIIAHPADAISAAGSFLSSVDLKDILKLGGQVIGEGLKTVGGGYNVPAAAAAPAPPKPTSSAMKYLPWAIGGVAALGIGYMLLKD